MAWSATPMGTRPPTKQPVVATFVVAGRRGAAFLEESGHEEALGEGARGVPAHPHPSRAWARLPRRRARAELHGAQRGRRAGAYEG